MCTFLNPNAARASEEAELRHVFIAFQQLVRTFLGYQRERLALYQDHLLALICIEVDTHARCYNPLVTIKAHFYDRNKLLYIIPSWTLEVIPQPVYFTYFLSDNRKPQLSENPKSRVSQLSEQYLTRGCDGCVSRLQRWDSRGFFSPALFVFAFFTTDLWSDGDS